MTTPNISSPMSDMSDDVIEAVHIGQQRCLRTRRLREQAQIELALDELLRHPLATGNPVVLLERALAHARTKMRRRATIDAFAALSPDVELRRMHNTDDTQTVDAIRAVAASPLRAHDRALLLFAIADTGTPRVCVLLNLSSTQAQQHLSRARARARECGLRIEVAA